MASLQLVTLSTGRVISAGIHCFSSRPEGFEGEWSPLTEAETAEAWRIVDARCREHRASRVEADPQPYRIEYRDARGRWHLARSAKFQLAGDAVRSAEAAYSNGWRVLDGDGRPVADHLGNGTAASSEAAGPGECEGHPAGPFDPMGETVYCDGSCVVAS